MDTRYFKFADLVSGNSPAARQFRTMYETAASFDEPRIVELGTRQGMSTTCFLTACEERGGQVVSIDIVDCSDVSDSPLVTFVQCDSADTKAARQKAPIVTAGIDLLFIDAMHNAAAVERDLTAWFGYVKIGGVIMLHDVDPLLYRRGARKDSWLVEHELSEVFSYLYRLFAANEDKLEFRVDYGLTGLATMRRTALGDLKPPVPSFRRSPLSRLRASVLSMKESLKGGLGGATRRPVG